MEKNTIFNEEEGKLKSVIELLNKKLEIAMKSFNEQEKTIIGYTEGLRGTQFNRQAFMSLYSSDIYKYNQLLKNPYFGRLNFKEKNSDKIDNIYIGKKSIVDGSNIISYDWRTPIASMYYDYSIGDVKYEYNGNKVEGQLLNKRQILIDNGILVKVEEKDVMTDDKLLIDCLNQNADSRLKSIISTIQKEQNAIIRNPLKNNYIVQGVAGSGKTTIALHRIAYQLYNESKNIKEANFLILGPNKYFLSYISELLPDLDIVSVKQNTFEQLLLDHFDFKIELETKNQMLQDILFNKVKFDSIKFKSSLEYLDLIKQFIKVYINQNTNKPIIYEGMEICSLEEINNFKEESSDTNNYGKNFDLLMKKVIKRIKENNSEISHEFWLKYKDEFLSLPKDSIRRKEILQETENINKNLKSGCQKQIKEYFKFLNLNTLNIYKLFLQSLDKYMSNENVCQEIKEYTLLKLKNKKIGYEDLVALFYIKFLLNDIEIDNNITHLIIDEGQDLSISEYYILKLLFQKCNFDIYGDLNQSIYCYHGINNWEELNEKIFNSNATMIEINKSYRTTKQISDCSKYVLSEFSQKKYECIGRDGEESNITFSDNLQLDLLIQIEQFINKGYKTIAIICKDSKETDIVYEQLSKIGLKLNKISEQDLAYNGGLCIMPSYISKGLEFDAVIIYNANTKNYNSNSEIDMKLLYVAITRALHELNINYNNQLTEPLEIMVKENAKQNKIKKIGGKNDKIIQ